MQITVFKLVCTIASNNVQVPAITSRCVQFYIIYCELKLPGSNWTGKEEPHRARSVHLILLCRVNEALINKETIIIITTQRHNKMFLGLVSHRQNCSPVHIVISQSEFVHVCVVSGIENVVKEPFREEPIDDYLVRECHVDVVAYCRFGIVVLAPQSSEYL